MKLTISRHAVERFRERGRPLSYKAACRELERLIPAATWQTHAPPWAMPVTEHDGCLVLGDLALIVQNNVIVTCITKGTIAPRERYKRQMRKKARRERLARRRGL